MQSLPISRSDTTTYRPSGSKLGFPAQQKVKLIYADKVTLTGASGLIENYQFRLNSLYDPDLTSTGHQPFGFDQWALFYESYVVTKATYEVYCQPSTGSTPVLVSAYVSDDASYPGVMNTIAENGGDVRLGSVQSPEYVFKGELDIAKYYRRAGSLTLDSALRALTSANPSEVVLLNLSAQSTTTSAAVSTFFVRLVFEARFMEPTSLAPS
jgi:hypothetical protein